MLGRGGGRGRGVRGGRGGRTLDEKPRSGLVLSNSVTFLSVWATVCTGASFFSDRARFSSIFPKLGLFLLLRFGDGEMSAAQEAAQIKNAIFPQPKLTLKTSVLPLNTEEISLRPASFGRKIRIEFSHFMVNT